MSGSINVAPAAPPARPARALLVAGEASGDMHAADLVRALRARCPGLEVFGVGGPTLRAEGMRVVTDAEDVATVGVVEGLGRLRALVRTYRALVRALREERPDLCILVDFPEFNLRLARAAKRAGVPVFYYIGPQVWAWRRGRVRTIGRRVDGLALVFPFEPALYEKTVPRARFVGHPLIDRVRVDRERTATLEAIGFDPAKRTVLLLPGSRPKEIEYLLPVFLAAARRMAGPDRQFVLALAPTLKVAEVETALADAGVPVRVVEGGTYDLMAAADVALVSSGTATLECALLVCPMVIAYKLAPLTAVVARVLVRGVSHIGLPNVVAGREIVPELVQGDVTPERVAREAEAILADPARRTRMIEDLRGVRARLGEPGAAERAADMAVALMRQGRS
jgi:lipid-A-disaccharide synthase